MPGPVPLGSFRAPATESEDRMAAASSVKVLIVDDYASMLGVLRKLLGQLGIDDIEEASDGSAALQKLRADTFGLVISDWNMEPMSGIQLLREMRADPALNDIPFIMVTAETRAESMAEAKAAGASGFIVKPFDAGTLRSKVAGVLGGI